MDGFLAHAIVDATAAAPGGSEARAAKALGVQLLGLAVDRPVARTWRVRTADGRLMALVVVADAASPSERAQFERAVERLVSAGPPAGTLRMHAAAPGHDAFLADLWTTGCAADLPTLHWPPSKRLEFVRRVAQAVEALHGCGVVHGCLSAHNVLLDDDLQPVLAEAGMVSVRELSARRGDASTYADFVAPEVKRGEEPDARSDVWSLGRLVEHLVGEAEVEHLGDILRRCVAPLPHLRYASAAELVAALDSLLATLPAEGTGSPSRRHAPERASRPGVAPSREAHRERPSAPGAAARAASGAAAAPRRLARALRWAPHAGAVLLAIAAATAYVLGAQTDGARGVLCGMVVVGAALVACGVPLPGGGGAKLRGALVASVAALVAVADPASWIVRAGAVRRLHGGEAARRAAVAEIIEAGRDFHGLELTGFDLSEMDLTGADLRRANLSRANLSGARLWAAQVEGASFDAAQLGHADLEETALGEARHLETARCDDATRLPSGWRCVDGAPRR
ncbi:MAG TPA: pentapeptide repeat-containing protein [Polyangiaceae bacterium]|nr:pentapeptide repeat-containing protein [Polyangiaceae bacterium]